MKKSWHDMAACIKWPVPGNWSSRRAGVFLLLRGQVYSRCEFLTQENGRACIGSIDLIYLFGLWFCFMYKFCSFGFMLCSVFPLVALPGPSMFLG